MPSPNPVPGVVQNVVELHGKYYQQNQAGNLYVGTTAVGGVVIPISTTLTPTFTLWNPGGSGVNLVPVVLLVGWSATTAALGTIGYTYTALTGNTISSTAPFVAFGSGIVLSGRVGEAGQSKARFSGGGTTTLVAASTWFRGSGIAIGATTAATTTLPMWMARDDFDGTMIIPPGNAVHVMGSTAIAITASMSLSWIEVPAS